MDFNVIKQIIRSLAMKLYEPFTAIFVAVIVVASAYAIFMKVKPGIIPEDNFIEEIIEDVLEDQTGWRLDITPNSPEEKARLKEDFGYLKLSDEAKI